MVAEFPYKGTLAELRQITDELCQLRMEQYQLEQQEGVLLEHRSRVLHLLAEKASQ